MDYLLGNRVQACGRGYVCMICGQTSKRWRDMKKHMEGIHISHGEDYYCPPCLKYFKNIKALYGHIIKLHKGWEDVYHDDFIVKS